MVTLLILFLAIIALLFLVQQLLKNSPKGKFLHLFIKKLYCYNVFENTCTSLNQNEVLTFGIKLFSGQV